MNKALFLISILALAIGCKIEYDDRSLLLKDAPLHIFPTTEIGSTSDPEHLSSREIVKQSYRMSWKNDKVMIDNFWEIAQSERDTITPKLIYWADYVINPYDTTITPSFINSYDLVIVRNLGDNQNKVLDTIAHIPNSVMREAQRLVLAAFNRGDYRACYELFNNFYVFKPITGEQWRALRAQDINQ